jgi:hypothetical protein
MKFESKAHMAQELMSGKRFTNNGEFVIYYDPTRVNPFRCNSYEMSHIWDAYYLDVWEEVKPKHVHQDLIDSYREGQVWQYRHNSKASWLDLSNHLTSWQPDWDEDTQYRIKPATKIVYEWMFKSKFEDKWMIEEVLLDEEEAKTCFKEHAYRKTGREFEVEV